MRGVDLLVDFVRVLRVQETEKKNIGLVRWDILQRENQGVWIEKKRQIEIGCTYTKKELEEPESDWTFCMESKAIKK